MIEGYKYYVVLVNRYAIPANKNKKLKGYAPQEKIYSWGDRPMSSYEKASDFAERLNKEEQTLIHNKRLGLWVPYFKKEVK